MDEQQEEKLRKTLGANARSARLREELTQEQVAERLDISPEVYGRIERGLIFPRVPTLVDLCRVLRKPSDEILGLMNGGTGGIGGEPAARHAESSPELRRLLPRLRKLTPDQLRALQRFLVTFQR
ncbi:helix-turn-helix transcriptional regulator [Myxococcaceae bacterium GXIMD 01537]